MKHRKIGILLPAYNEGRKIGKVIKDIKKEGFTEIVVVNDGSKDVTAEVARKAGAVVFSHPINLGVGAALATGISIFKKKDVDVMVMLDADGQHDVKDIKKVIKPILENKADFVLGSRLLNPKGMPLIRKIGNFGLNVFTFLVSGVWVTDTQTGFRALTREVIKSLDLKSRGYEVASEMIIRAKKKKFRIAEVPITVIYTRYSLSKGQSVINGIKTAWSILKNRLLH